MWTNRTGGCSTGYRRDFLLVGVIWLLLSAPSSIAGQSFSVTDEQWARINTAAEFMAIPGLRELVGQFSNSERQPASQAVIEVHYAGGESGQLWAQQFRNRLVGLGLESDRIELVQGVSSPNRLEILLRAN